MKKPNKPRDTFIECPFPHIPGITLRINEWGQVRLSSANEHGEAFCIVLVGPEIHALAAYLTKASAWLKHEEKKK